MSGAVPKPLRAPRTYCSRAKLRLRIAGRLLRWRGGRSEAVDDHWCDEVLAIIERLPGEHRCALKEHVDWVEAYESAELTPGWRR